MYFVSKDNKKEGPLSLEEVKKLKLTEDILVWKEGLINWVSIKEIPELKDFVIITPPLLPDELIEKEKQELQQIRFEKGKNFFLKNLLLIPIIMALLSFIHYYGAFNSSGSGLLDNLFPVFLSQEERSNPLNFILKNLPYSLLFSIIILLTVSLWKAYNIKNDVLYILMLIIGSLVVIIYLGWHTG